MTLFMFLVYLLNEVGCTIDINLAEFNYLSNHLQPEECRKLVAALHFKNSVNINAIDEAERKVPEDIPCLRLLLHWNSAKGEGFGETHEILRQKLLLIGRKDLADWLGIIIFKTLGEELDKDLHDPFNNLLDETTEDIEIPLPTLPAKDSNVYDWTSFDTICFVIILVLSVGTFIMLIGVCILRARKHVKIKQQENKMKKEGYTEITQNVSDSESEVKFDIRGTKGKKRIT